MRYAGLICWSVLGIFMATVVNAEKSPVSLGVLTCTLVASAQKMTCGFKPVGTGAEEKYDGTIHESRQELPAGKVVLIWAVLGPSDKMRAGVLAQRYVKGKSVAGQGPRLMGETNPAIVLQLETNDGSAAYDTIALVELVLSGTPA
jgi:hypothetical protein